MTVYRNGELPSDALYEVGGVKLAKKPAHDLKRAMAHHKWRPINGMSGYRSIEMQRELRADPDRWNALPTRYQAAVGASSHGLGHAVDLTGWYTRRDLLALRFYGWKRTNPVGDPNHFEHR